MNKATDQQTQQPPQPPPKRRRGRPTNAERQAWQQQHPDEVTERMMRRTAQAMTTLQPPDTMSPELAERIGKLSLPSKDGPRARFWLVCFANSGSYRQACNAAAATAAHVAIWRRQSPAFNDIFHEIKAANEQHAAAMAIDAVAKCAAGDYEPQSGKLPPDMRAASILLPALDQRFRANAPGNGNQVQINISI